MPSLADLPEVIGFFSYSREDDEAFQGTLSGLRDAIQRELGAQLGRSKAAFRLWQDKEAIAPGKMWESAIKNAVEQSVFFIPIVTPRMVNSKYCKFEFDEFLARERALGRDDLVFPILYVPIPALEDEAQWRNHPVLSPIAKRQYVDWQTFRYADVYTPAMREAIGRFARKIVEALHRSWMPSVELRREEEAAAQRQEPERLRQDELEVRRRTEEEAQRSRIEADARRRADERRQQDDAKDRADQDARRKQADAEARQRAEQARGTSPRWAWQSAAVLSDGRARFAVGSAILMNAMLWFVLMGIASYDLGHYADWSDLFFWCLLTLLCVIGILTMRGITQIQFLTLGALTMTAVISLFVAIAVPLSSPPPSAVQTLGWLTAWPIFIASTIFSIFVCVRWWRMPLQTSLLRPGMKGADFGILSLLLICPYWATSLFFFTVHYRFLSSEGLLAVCGTVFILCLLFSIFCSKIWASPQVPSAQSLRPQGG